jgi:Flp pilus assembly pilin Flp
MRSTTSTPHRDLLGATLAWWCDESGVSSIEYGLVAALIVIVCIGAFTAYADALQTIYETWADAVIAALT